MGVLDSLTTSKQVPPSSSSIPVPESDLAINQPPQKQHERVVGFVRVSKTSWLTKGIEVHGPSR